MTEPIGWQTLQRLTALRADQARNNGPVGVREHDRNRREEAMSPPGPPERARPVFGERE